MIIIKEQRFVDLKVDDFRKILNYKHPELKEVKETELLIGITHDHLVRLLKTKEKVKKIRLITALNMCNYLDISPSSILVTDGTIKHELKMICAKEITSKVDSDNCEYDEISLNEREHQDTEELYFLENMNYRLKKDCSGLLMATGKKGRVSFAIASVVAYLRMIVNDIPKLKENTYSLVTAIAAALDKATLDDNEQIVFELWPGLKNNIVELTESVALPNRAEKEANLIIEKMQQSRLYDNDIEKLEAVHSALYWIVDYWRYLYHKDAAYKALRDISCILKDAATDYKIRKNLVITINSFIHQVSIYDKNGIFKL